MDRGVTIIAADKNCWNWLSQRRYREVTKWPFKKKFNRLQSTLKNRVKIRTIIVDKFN